MCLFWRATFFFFFSEQVLVGSDRHWCWWQEPRQQHAFPAACCPVLGLGIASRSGHLKWGAAEGPKLPGAIPTLFWERLLERARVGNFGYLNYILPGPPSCTRWSILQKDSAACPGLGRCSANSTPRAVISRGTRAVCHTTVIYLPEQKHLNIIPFLIWESKNRGIYIFWPFYFKIYIIKYY